MIPRLSPVGSSFKGAFRYFLHDKGKDSQDRVAWTHTENLLTDNPDKAWKVMAYTAKNAERLKEASGQKRTGRKMTQPVLTYSLAWHPDQSPDRAAMLSAARKSLAELGFQDHETIIICHNDEPQAHIHIVVNRVHPLTGLASSTSHSKRKLSDWALNFEKEDGKIYCKQREVNHEKRKRQQPTRYGDPVIVQAWQQSDSGQSFKAALSQQGYHLCQGRKRPVIVDRYGKALNPTRHLEGVRARDLQQKLRDLTAALPDATELSRRIQADNRRQYFESVQHDRRVIHAKNRAQNRQLEERAKLNNQHAEKISEQEEQLAHYYGLNDQDAKIAMLRSKVQKAGWLKRLMGFAKKEKELLHTLELSRQNAEWRKHEKMQHLRSEKEKAVQSLAARQTEQQKNVLHRLEAQKPKDYVNLEERKKLIEHLRERQRAGRARNGPSLER